MDRWMLRCCSRSFVIWLVSGLLAVMAALSPDDLYAQAGFDPPESGPAALAAPQRDLPCSASPFGSVIELGKEREIFLGFRDNDLQQAGAMGAYRFDIVPETRFLQEQNLVINGANGRNQISHWAGVATDLDGDGQAEFVQAFTDANGRNQMIVHRNGQPFAETIGNALNHTRRAIAAGDLMGLDDGSSQVVIVSRSAADVLTVAIYRFNDGKLQELTGVYRSTVQNRSQPDRIRVAVGNLDNDGYADIVIAFLQAGSDDTAQLLYLEYDETHETGSGDNEAWRIRERAFKRITINKPMDIQLALADLNGDGQDSIIFASDAVQTSTPGLSPTLAVRTFTFDPQTSVIKDGPTWHRSSESFNFALAAGDLDGDFNGALPGNRRDEVVIGYYSAGIEGQFQGLNIETLRLTGLATANPTLESTDRWSDNTNLRNVAHHLALAVDDVNKDTRDEVVAALKDNNPFGFQMLYLEQQFDANGAPTGLALVASGRFDLTINGPINLVMGDWNGDSLRAYAQGKCARVTDERITAAGFVPPYWKNIQGAQEKGGSIGRSVSQQAGVEHSLTYMTGHTTSGYVGLTTGGSIFDVIKLGATVRATGAREYTQSNKRSTSVITTTVTTVGQSWSNDALVYEPAEYRCFSYQVADGSTYFPPTDVAVRFCEYQSLGPTVPLVPSELNSWDKNFRTQVEYAPVVRDWSNLALFRGPFTRQSSNGASAPLAVDSEIVAGTFYSATVAQTNSQANPWWQVDLGAVHELTKIRLWTPPGTLSNFYLFVSNTDFTTLSGHENPANLVGRAGVRHYTLADILPGTPLTATAGAVTTFVTLDAQEQPIRGRYIRVQRADTAVLALAEVQVFGPNHVEPDRYPLQVEDRPEFDGFFRVLLFNPFHTGVDDRYQWVKVRGNLLWNGANVPALNALLVARGNATANWSMSEIIATQRVTAKELSNSTRIGYEFELEGGVIYQLQVGGGEEWTYGMATETIHTTGWSNEFNMGGLMRGFPGAYDGSANEWVVRCQYRFVPYYYEVTEQSSLGYRHRFPVLDYLVPDAGRDSDLDRLADLTPCRNGNLPAAAPQANSDALTVPPGESYTFDVLANDLGNDLQIIDVGQPQHGEVVFNERTITYTPQPGFSGVDSFTYIVSDGATQAEGAVTVYIGVEPDQQLYLPLIQQ